MQCDSCSRKKDRKKPCSAYIELLQQRQRQVQCSVRIARSRTSDRSKSSPLWRPATTFIQPVIEFITTLTCTFINHLSLNYFLWPGSVSVFASVHVTCIALLYGLDYLRNSWELSCKFLIIVILTSDLDWMELWKEIWFHQQITYFTTMTF